MSASRKTLGWKPLLGGFVGGALVFWTPSIILHAFSPNFGTLGEPLYLTAVVPMLVVMVLVAPRWPRRLTLAALLGIWMLGPLFMMVSATFSGGGFHKEGVLTTLLLGTVAFPIFTFLMSAYDGTIFALAITTVLLGVVIRIDRRHATEGP